jgi:hypothetical protein
MAAGDQVRICEEAICECQLRSSSRGVIYLEPKTPLVHSLSRSRQIKLPQQNIFLMKILLWQSVLMAAGDQVRICEEAICECQLTT